MRKIWIHRDIDAPADAVWALLVSPAEWPNWGPTVRSARLDGDRLELGATGAVGTVVGPELRFEITSFEAGHRWSWKVAGVEATDHRVESLADDRCRLGFGVPWVVAPYLVVCETAMKRIQRLAEKTEDGA